MTFLSVYQTIYVTVGLIAIVLAIFLIVFLFYHNFYARKHIRELTFLKLSRICEHNDYLLLNEYEIAIDDKNVGVIDHIVISDKYIILINDFAISGVLSGDYRGEEFYNTKKGGTEVVANPINYNINLAKRLALFNDLKQSFIKGLVVINNDSLIDVSGMDEQFKIIKRKDLAKTIRKFDKENVKKLNEESVVKFINYLNDSKNK